MSRDLSVHIAKYRGNLLDVAQHACATLSTVIHDETPRDTGRAQNGWAAGVNGYGDPGGSFTRAAGALAMGDQYTFLNRVPYIRRLEYGWSRQAPAGMVRVNVARWDDIVVHSTREVAR